MTPIILHGAYFLNYIVHFQHLLTVQIKVDILYIRITIVNSDMTRNRQHVGLIAGCDGFQNVVMNEKQHLNAEQKVL